MNNYKCPKCRSFLNVNDHILFTVIGKRGETGLVMLDQKLGDYSASYNDQFAIADGEKIEFRCPVCHAYLHSDFENRLAEILMVDDNGIEFRIVFSKVKGEKSTFSIQGESVEVFGEHAENYIDFVTLSQLT